MRKMSFVEEDARNVAAKLLRERQTRRLSHPAALLGYRRESVIDEPIAKTTSASAASSRRGSDADSINWIAKYNKSDHHYDRMVNSKLEHVKALGGNEVYTRAFGNQADKPSAASYTPVTRPSSYQPVQPIQPHRFEGTNKLTVFLQTPTTSRPPTYRKSDEQSTSAAQRLRSSTYIYPHQTNVGKDYEQFSSRLTSFPGVSSSTLPTKMSRERSYLSNATNERQTMPASAYRRRSIDTSSLIRPPRSSIYSRAMSPGVTVGPSSTFAHSSSPVSSKYATDSLIQHYNQSSSSPYRHSGRAPSLPPSLSSSSSAFANGLLRRPSAEGLTSELGLGRKRSSIAGTSVDLTPYYRRSVDFNSSKSERERSEYLSSEPGSNFRRRSSYDGFSSSSGPLPPPSQRLFGARGTHSSVRRNRNLSGNS